MQPGELGGLFGIFGVQGGGIGVGDGLIGDLAICAGVGAGVYRDLWDGQRIVGEPSSSDAPDPANRAACEELYARYCALREEVLK